MLKFCWYFYVISTPTPSRGKSKSSILKSQISLFKDQKEGILFFYFFLLIYITEYPYLAIQPQNQLKKPFPRTTRYVWGLRKSTNNNITSSSNQQPDKQQPAKTEASRQDRSNQPTSNQQNNKHPAKRMFVRPKNVIDKLRVFWYSKRVIEECLY